MKLRALEELVQQGEGQMLEFKLKANFPDKIVKEMVAFANSKGGHLLVGVNDDGNIPGLKFVEEERYILEKAIRLHAKPTIRYAQQIIPLNQKRSVLVYRIFEYKKKPGYFLHDPQKRGKAYIRVDDRCVQASREMIGILKHSKKKNSKPIRLGENEHLLFRQIELQGKATVTSFMNASGLNRYQASNILVRLVTSNILHIQQGDKMDFFTMKNIE